MSRPGGALSANDVRAALPDGRVSGDTPSWPAAALVVERRAYNDRQRFGEAHDGRYGGRKRPTADRCGQEPAKRGEPPGAGESGPERPAVRSDCRLTSVAGRSGPSTVANQVRTYEGIPVRVLPGRSIDYGSGSGPAAQFRAARATVRRCPRPEFGIIRGSGWQIGV